MDKDIKIRYANDYDTAEVKALWNECFKQDSDAWKKWYFENIFRAYNVNCIFIDKKLISMVHMNPYPIIIHNKKIKSFALSGVATYEQHRKHGYAGKLIENSLKDAYKRGMSFSFLSPFSYPYYEKFAYKHSYNKYSYTFKPENKKTKIIIKERFDNKKLTDIYNDYAKAFNGYVIRDKGYTAVHIDEYECDGKRLYCFSLNNDYGYFILGDKDNGFEIEEIAYEGDFDRAYSEIVNYLGRETAFVLQPMIDDKKGVCEKHCMTRIINIKALFDGIRCKKDRIVIKIKDNIITENDNTFAFDGLSGRLKVYKTDETPDYQLDIADFGPIVTGLSQDNDIAVEIINRLFCDSNPFIIEVC